MKLLFSVPSGYHLRELLLPLKHVFEPDSDISEIFVVTPVADIHEEVFAEFGGKVSCYQNPVDATEHTALLQKLKPDIVITNTVGHDQLDYPILQAADELNIPTLTFIASWDNVWKIGRLLRNDIPVHVADHFIVWNEMMKRHLLQLFPELSGGQIAVIGAPRLDYFWQKNIIPSKEQVYQLLGFEDVNKPFIHFATTELYPMDYVVEAVAEAIKHGQLPDLYLYASVHPGGNIQNHQQLQHFGATVKYSFGRVARPPHPDFAYIPTEADILNLVGVFTHAGALVNQSSTTALESLIAGTPVINVTYGRLFDWWRWYRSMVYRDFKQHYIDLVRDDATYLVKNKHQLIAAIQQALKAPHAKDIAAKKTVQRMITTTDGTASQKVLTEIKKHAKKA